jgi:hypothetical protein
MRTIKDLTIKDKAAVLYKHYMDNYCENDFCFDNGKLREKIKDHLNSLSLSADEMEMICKEITVHVNHGTDYDNLVLEFTDGTPLFFQVSDMYDYDGDTVDEYDEPYHWIDVGLFFVNYAETNFDDLT